MTELTNESLGGLIGLTHSAVSRLLAGERTPSIKTMKRIAKVFDRPLTEVVEAGSQTTVTDQRGHLWGVYFTELVSTADLDKVRERAEQLDLNLATAAG
jgi:transcriptional regulator with XRE-family HTH domain